MNHTAIIGLEVHVQLLTRSKLFCGCPNRFNPDEPNTQVCPVCLGLPGTLPVMNREAFRLAARTGLALNCEIAEFSKWDRKHYYYPDLPKNYQISQYDLPFSSDGYVEIAADPDGGETRRVRIIRAHLEEDAGKNLHDETGRGADSLVDLNRTGTPLVEIVTEPDLRSAREARIFLEELRLLLTYLEVSDCNMQEGSLRCDANVNLHVATDDGHKAATPIVEVKNLNTFRGIEQAIDYEIHRQLGAYQQTGRKLGDPGVFKETRGWDAARGVTYSQRSKEEVSDYRYLPDPDLVPVTVSPELLDEIRGTLVETPSARRTRFQDQYQLSHYDASVIVAQGRRFAEYFEEVTEGCGDGKLAANWVTQDVARAMNERSVTIEQFPIGAEVLAALVRKVKAGEITTKSGRDVFSGLLTDADDGRTPSVERIDELIDAKGLAIIADTGQLQSAVDAVIARNPKAVEDFKGGKQQAVGKLIGEVIREVKGADAKVVRQMLVERLVS